MDQNDKFWNDLEKRAESVRKWPAWKRGKMDKPSVLTPDEFFEVLKTKRDKQLYEWITDVVGSYRALYVENTKLQKLNDNQKMIIEKDLEKVENNYRKQLAARDERIKELEEQLRERNSAK